MLNDVKDFGACGNGIADDRVAIQAAIDDAAARGRAGILIPADLTIAGEGPRSIVRLVPCVP